MEWYSHAVILFSFGIFGKRTKLYEKHYALHKDSYYSIYPAICYFYIWWFPASLLQNPESYGELSFGNAIVKPLIGMALGIGRDTDFSIMIDVPLWFLPALFFVKIIHNISWHANKYNKHFYRISVIAAIIISLFLRYMNLDLPFSISHAWLFFPFFSMGYLLKKGNGMVKVEKNPNIYPFLILGVIGFFLLTCFAQINGRTDISEWNYGKDILLFYAKGLLGIISSVFLSQAYRCYNKYIMIIASGTIVIMALHEIPTRLILRIVRLITQQGDDLSVHILVGILVSVIVVLSFILPIIIIKKYFPILLGGKK
jgi:hypothetical protein